jgi:hypothetical protein
MPSNLPQPAFETPMQLGESPLWSPGEATLYWIDIPGRAVHRLHPASRAHRQWPMPSEPGCIALCDGGLVVALRSGLAFLDTERGQLSPFLQAPDIAAIGITNQRETTVLWDRATGQPSPTPSSGRTGARRQRCDQLRAQGHAARIQKKTGLVIDAYFSGTKLEWLLDNVPGARERAERGELAFGTIDSWLVWNLTGGRVHATDASNASRTMLFNLHTQDWDDELLALLRVPRAVLPEVVPFSGVMAKATLRCSARHARSPAWRATSRPPPSARPASRPAWPRTPMAPAASC